MMTVTLEEAQAHLSELIENLQPGESITITRDQKPIALVMGTGNKPTRQLGTMKGSVLYMASDFDAPLDDFREYME